MLTLDYRGHTLIAVPAVHYRAVFAEMVNRICADEETRPAAVAVELEPGAAAAVAAWLRELGVAPGGKPLPYVLGLLARNRLIHPRFRAAALRLQETTGYQLQELSPRLLARELGYVPTELLPLTPTDSITEAIRCALELDLALGFAFATHLHIGPLAAHLHTHRLAAHRGGRPGQGVRPGGQRIQRDRRPASRKRRFTRSRIEIADGPCGLSQPACPFLS